MDRDESSVYYAVLQIMDDLGFNLGYSELAANNAVRLLDEGMSHDISVDMTVNKYNNTYD